MNVAKKIAVLITCYNRKEKTLSSLSSLFTCKLPDFHELDVFLVDDASADGTGDAVRTKFPKVRVLQGTGELFWNRGMHLAWKTAARHYNYDYYLWLNDDVTLYPKAIEALFASAYEIPGSIICGSTQSSINGQITYGGEDLKRDKVIPNGRPQKCKLFNGNIVLVPKTVYNKIGMLDPIYPHAIGDFDYAMRAYKNKISAYIAGEYLGICQAHNTLPQWCLRNVKFKDRVRSLYSPLGSSHPYYFFIYEKKNWGLARAMKHFVSIHLRLIFPSLWKDGKMCLMRSN